MCIYCFKSSKCSLLDWIWCMGRPYCFNSMHSLFASCEADRGEAVLFCSGAVPRACFLLGGAQTYKHQIITEC